MNKLKYLFLPLIILSALFFLSPQEAEAGSGFGGLSIKARKLTSSGTFTDYSGLNVNWTSTKTNSYKWKLAGGSCYGCDSAAFWTGSSAVSDLTLTTNSNGEISYGTANNKGAACGASECGKDAGTCNPFTISGTASGDYDADKSYWMVNGVKQPNGFSFLVDYTVINGSDKHYNLDFYGRRDRLSVDFNIEVIDGQLDCIDGQADPVSAATNPNTDGVVVRFKNISHSHDASPDDHTVRYYGFDWTNNGSVDLWTTATTYDKKYTWAEIGGISGASKTINARVYVSCNSPGSARASRTKSFSVSKSPRRAVCTQPLPVSPRLGYLPLTVNFNPARADIIRDNYCQVSPSQYEWTFGDGQTRVTSLNHTSYTYLTKGDFLPSVKALTWPGGLSLPEISCPSEASVQTEYWTESNWTEVAP